MSEEYLDCVERDPSGPVRAATIWLHGLGADGYDFAGFVPMLNLPEDGGYRFVFPHAPVLPVTINGGLPMRAWWDIRSIDLRRDQDEEGIRHSQRLLEALIDREVKSGVSADRIVLAGFSQGAAIALQTGLRYPERLGGILALSTMLVLPDALEAEASPANADVPIFMAHGAHDPVIPFSIGVAGRDLLQERGYDVEWHEYPMEHHTVPEEAADVGAWYRRILP